jgi:hypothetical protein
MPTESIILNRQIPSRERTEFILPVSVLRSHKDTQLVIAAVGEAGEAAAG